MKSVKLIIPALLLTLLNLSIAAQAAAHDANLPHLMASLQSPYGEVKISGDGQPYTTLVFKNDGPTLVLISHVQIQTKNETLLVTERDMAVGIGPGRSMHLSFSNKEPVSVDMVYFVITKSAGPLEIYGLNHSGLIPSGFSAGN